MKRKFALPAMPILAFGLALAISSLVLADSGQHMRGKMSPRHVSEPRATTSAGRGGLLMPIMNAERGRKVFAAKGCVICHAINGVGGDHGPSLDMRGMGPMNPFDFAAKMWEGAEAMIVLQEQELGERISLTGQDLADMIAFVHSPSEIAKFSKKDIPHKIWDVLQKTHGKTDNHGEKGKKH